jgi:integrative and conjugative element protein (TIGR02256 family)
MTTWTGRTSDGTYGLQIEEPVLRALDQMCRDAGVIETGGVLVGRYSADLAVAIVREATPPPTDSRRGRSWFERGVAGLRDMLWQRWRSKERSYYLGEWHFHPAPRVEPSSDDFAQMARIAEAEGYDCKEPLLVILGAGQKGGRREMRAFVCAKGTSPLELVGEEPDVPSEEPPGKATS